MSWRNAQPQSQLPRSCVGFVVVNIVVVIVGIYRST